MALKEPSLLTECLPKALTVLADELSRLNLTHTLAAADALRPLSVAHLQQCARALDAFAGDTHINSIESGDLNHEATLAWYQTVSYVAAQLLFVVRTMSFNAGPDARFAVSIASTKLRRTSDTSSPVSLFDIAEALDSEFNDGRLESRRLELLAELSLPMSARRPDGRLDGATATEHYIRFRTTLSTYRDLGGQLDDDEVSRRFMRTLPESTRTQAGLLYIQIKAGGASAADSLARTATGLTSLAVCTSTSASAPAMPAGAQPSAVKPAPAHRVNLIDLSARPEVDHEALGNAAFASSGPPAAAREARGRGPPGTRPAAGPSTPDGSDGNACFVCGSRRSRHGWAWNTCIVIPPSLRNHQGHCVLKLWQAHALGMLPHAPPHVIEGLDRELAAARGPAGAHAGLATILDGAYGGGLPVDDDLCVFGAYAAALGDHEFAAAPGDDDLVLAVDGGATVTVVPTAHGLRDVLSHRGVALLGVGTGISMQSGFIAMLSGGLIVRVTAHVLAAMTTAVLAHKDLFTVLRAAGRLVPAIISLDDGILLRWGDCRMLFLLMSTDGLTRVRARRASQRSRGGS